MTEHDLGQLERLIDARLTAAEVRLEQRLTRMVNERNTSVIDATTARCSSSVIP